MLYIDIIALHLYLIQMKRYVKSVVHYMKRMMKLNKQQVVINQKMYIRKFETMCFLLSAREVLNDVPTFLRMLSTIFMDFQNKTGIGV